MNDTEAVYLTICLDVFADYVAPGVSARSTLGLLPVQVLSLIRLSVKVVNLLLLI